MSEKTVTRSIPSGRFTCPMHPEVRAEKPGLCPKCGMAIEMVYAASAAGRTEYTCRMRPEIVRDQPAIVPFAAGRLSRVTYRPIPQIPS